MTSPKVLRRQLETAQQRLYAHLAAPHPDPTVTDRLLDAVEVAQARVDATDAGWEVFDAVWRATDDDGRRRLAARRGRAVAIRDVAAGVVSGPVLDAEPDTPAGPDEPLVVAGSVEPEPAAVEDPDGVPTATGASANTAAATRGVGADGVVEHTTGADPTANTPPAGEPDSHLDDEPDGDESVDTTDDTAETSPTNTANTPTVTALRTVADTHADTWTRELAALIPTRLHDTIGAETRRCHSFHRDDGTFGVRLSGLRLHGHTNTILRVSHPPLTTSRPDVDPTNLTAALRWLNPTTYDTETLAVITGVTLNTAAQWATQQPR